MNMSAITVCRNRHGAVYFSISLYIAGIKTRQWHGHFPHKLHIFNNGGAMAYPTAQSAQNSSPVFLHHPAIVTGSG
jgi:hypothetical protein